MRAPQPRIPPGGCGARVRASLARLCMWLLCDAYHPHTNALLGARAQMRVESQVREAQRFCKVSYDPLRGEGLRVRLGPAMRAGGDRSGHRSTLPLAEDTRPGMPIPRPRHSGDFQQAHPAYEQRQLPCAYESPFQSHKIALMELRI